MPKFIPYPSKVLILPINEEKMLTDGNDRKEVGEVLAVGSAVKFLKVGDIVFFGQWGYNETAEYEGQSYAIVEVDANFIQGKIPKIESKKKPV
jgi:co-chaperonin GroES (HSP10)